MNTDKQWVLSCIDGSSYSEAVCDYSAWIAKTTGAPLKLLHTIEHSQIPAVADYSGAIGLGSSEELLDELTKVEADRSRLMLEKGRLMLQAAKSKANTAGVSDVQMCHRHGSLLESLVEMEDFIRVLVVGIRGEQHEQTEKGVGHKLETMVRSLHKPIFVVNKKFSEPKQIMLAYDGSDSAQKALQMVANSPLFKHMPCHLVHVAPTENSSAPLLNEAEQKLRNAGIAVSSIHLQGKTEDVLPAYQAEHNIDLTVMGAFSHNRVRDFLLGSFTATMLQKTQKPLLLLR